ncbi:uroporphyrinogen-III synthase [Agrococcus sp. SL85]|nr:uroporphyrinogen-III synthase [Agrococcus sp. SL85]WAC67447.1 uroporphyrinogen-III synthase [Agrococcus sp. SL85]
MRVLIPRGGSWGDDVARRVADAGHEPLVLPLVAIEPADDQERLRASIQHLAEGRFDWLVVTSQSTVRVLPRIPASVRVAAVGSVTAAALRERGVPVAFIPTRQSAAGLVDEWPIREGRVLWPHARDARPTIAEGLRHHGMQVSEVVAYRTEPVYADGEALRAALAADAADGPGAEPADGEPLQPQAELQAAGHDAAPRATGTAADEVGSEAGTERDAAVADSASAPVPIDAVLVTSGSIAKQVARLTLPEATRVIAIGEQTAEDCRKHGLRVAAVAAQPSAAGLVAALVAAPPAA